MVCLFVCFQQVIPLPLLLSGNFTPTILNSPPPTMAKLSPGEQDSVCLVHGYSHAERSRCSVCIREGVA